MKKKLKITLNAPFTLGFALLCGLATLLCAVSGECTVLLFSTHASPMTDPLMYLRLFTHVLGHSGLAHLIGNMTLEEAVLFAKDAEAKLFIPLHIDMFAMNTIPKSYIPAGVDQYNKGMPYHIFTPGERFIFMK